MKLKFTNHALERCHQWGFNPLAIERALKDVPMFSGELTWRMNGGHCVVLKSVKGEALVVTFVHKKRLYINRR